MRSLYLLLLGGCLVATAVPLETALHTRVLARWRRLLLTLAPVLVAFCAWDVWAIAEHHWRYDRAQTSGLVLPGGLPVEEVVFFLVVPTCAVLALEAVRAVRGWPMDDEE